MTPEEEARVFERLELVKTPGALEARLWQNPAEWVEMQKIIVEDAAEGGDDYSAIDRIFDGRMTFSVKNTPTKRRAWGKWNLDHIDPSHRLYVIASLYPVAHLDQSQFNFLTCADAPERRYTVARGAGHVDTENSTGMNFSALSRGMVRKYRPDQETQDLANAFARRMVEEAEPYRSQVLSGQFEMERIKLDRVDALIKYHAMRLIINRQGIAASLIGEQDGATTYVPFFWSPETFTGWCLGGSEAFCMQVMLACIWRDACILRQTAFVNRHRGFAMQRAKPKQYNKMILPRVRHVGWAMPAERDYLTRERHAVKFCYRPLPAGQMASDQARENAKELNQPEPPTGFTFVKPYQRGGEAGDPDVEPRTVEIVCRGLQAAAIALG